MKKNLKQGVIYALIFSSAWLNALKKLPDPSFKSLKLVGNSLIDRKSRMPQIQGVRGRSRRSLPEAMGYHRLSQRVNKMEIFFKNGISLIKEL
jgi:hypothetical protein